jgi:ribosomal protein S18 acetylase RimI-like enzyme
MVTQVRRVHAEEWQQVRTLRLEALQDEAAPIAYLETYANAAARPDDFWQERAAGAAEGRRSAQVVAITADDAWVGSVTGLREEPGSEDWSGRPIEHLQVHVVGVWVRPEHRGAGLLAQLVDELESWARAGGVERLRLLVHEDNARARAAYRKLGFVPTGVVVPLEAGNELEMVRAFD